MTSSAPPPSSKKVTPTGIELKHSPNIRVDLIYHHPRCVFRKALHASPRRRGACDLLTLFQGIRPVKRAAAIRDSMAGVVLAAMNIPQALGYTRIAGMPVVTGL